MVRHMSAATISTIVTVALVLGIVSWVVAREVRRQRVLPEGRAFRAAWARLDRRERRKVNLLVNKGEASDDPRLAAAAVALIRLMRVIDPADRRGDATRAKVFLILFVVVVGLAVWGSVRGSETAWVTWFVACTSLFNLVVFGVVIPRRRRHLPERLAAAERANLETLARETP
jgi:hypothetical protein